jgi:rSAM/selenodomain-associated transferase 1
VLAIVARFPEPGRVKTRLAATIGDEDASSIYRAFLVDLAARFSEAARHDGYGLIWAQAPGLGDLRTIVGLGTHVIAQRGSDFAERLHNVCCDLAAMGSHEIVIIGSDSPHLPAAWVANAFGMVARGEVALGPAEDGGYYLIGVPALPAVPDLFQGIQMSTEHVLDDTRERAASLGLSVGMLPTTFDVDKAEALVRLAHALASPTDEIAACAQTCAALEQLASRQTGLKAGAADRLFRTRRVVDA